jgi:hypothetical protein
MATTYKGYTDQSTGSNSGTWGDVLNDEALDYIDLNLGGIVAKALTNVNVTLTASESRNAILTLSGTLTGAVVITTECLGFFFVENNCTGAFVVTVRNNLVATAVTIPQGTRQIVISDSTNGCRLGVSYEFPLGTVMTFRQSSAPTGWTKDTTNYNNSAFRCVTGAVSQLTSGMNFTDAFATRTITVAMLPDHSITITDPGHTHRTKMDTEQCDDSNQQSVWAPTGTGTDNAGPTSGFAFTGITAAFGDTARGGAQQTMPFNVNYVDLIVATKNAY